MQVRLRYRVVGPIQTNVYFLTNEETGETLIFDPGDEAQKLKATVEKYKLKPAAILLTHGHVDHILAINDLRAAYGIPLYAGEKEQELLDRIEWNHSAVFGFPTRLKADHWVKEGDLLSLGGFRLKVLETPGHSAGSVCYYDAENGLLFSGDTLFCESYGRTDLPTGSETDMQRSIRRLLTELPPDTQVFPGHEGFTTVAHERMSNPLAGGVWE